MTIRTAMLLTILWGAQLLSSAMLQDVATQPVGQQKTAITAANWRQSPEIIAIDKIVAATDARLKNRTYKTSERRFEYCGNAQLTVRKVADDSKGAIPWYENYMEGQDESWDFHYYYDDAGHLRFVSALARSANGTREQLRIYFDENGKRLWKTDKLLAGRGCPGCFSAYYDSDKALAFDPAKDFASDQDCKETKPPAK